MSEILAHVIRGKTLESIHRGHMIVIDADGQRLALAGDPSTVTYFRSSCKPHQSIPLMTSGAADAFVFTEEETISAKHLHTHASENSLEITERRT